MYLLGGSLFNLSPMDGEFAPAPLTAADQHLNIVAHSLI
jgi:hypothetical protein